MLIITPNDAGGVDIIRPYAPALEQFIGTTEEKIAAMANKILPPATQFEIINDADLPTDLTWRDSWTYFSGPNEQITGGA